MKRMDNLFMIGHYKLLGQIIVKSNFSFAREQNFVIKAIEMITQLNFNNYVAARALKIANVLNRTTKRERMSRLLRINPFSPERCPRRHYPTVPSRTEKINDV